MGNEHVIPEFANRRCWRSTGNQFPIQGAGRETRCFCYIDDCVDGLMCLYERGEDRNVYHLGEPARGAHDQPCGVRGRRYSAAR